jgi:hypothetical protein
MNYDFVTLMAAQDITKRFLQEPLPDSPVVADIGYGPRAGRIDRIRAGLSDQLVALAGRISPEPDYLSEGGVVFAPSGKPTPNAC